MKNVNTEEELIDMDIDSSDISEDIELEEIVDLDDDGNEKGLATKNKELRIKIKELEKTKAEYLDGWQRAKADSINREKSIIEDKKNIIELANKKLMINLVPVMDSFLMAMSNKEAWDKVDPNWRIGVEYIKTQLETVFMDNGLEIFGKVGEKADPNKYNTLETVATDSDTEDNTVAEILQYGYTLSGKVLREAKCKTFIKQ
jgi:molecular chaperone GrpE